MTRPRQRGTLVGFRSRLIPHPSVVARRLDDTVVLVHLDTNRIFTLNRTGTEIWDLLAAGQSETEIQQSLLERFAIAPDDVHHELEAFVGLLLTEALVVEAHGG